MSTYTLPSGEQLLVCDRCGIDHNGSKPDLSGAAKLGLTAEMLAAGFPPGTAASVIDTCPACEKREREVKL